MTTRTETDAEQKKSLTEKAQDAAKTAGEKVFSASSATVQAAKDHPYAAAGIAAGVAAAVAGAAIGATKLREGDGEDEKTYKSAQ